MKIIIMKKKSLKSLRFTKKSISNLTSTQTLGGFDTTSIFVACNISERKEYTCYFSCPTGTAC